MKLLFDSSCWLEYFARSPLCAPYRERMERSDSIIMPTVILHEVFRKLLREAGEDASLRAIAYMQAATPVELDAELALLSARLGLELGLPLADSVIYASARRHRAFVITHDAHFKDLSGVEYWPK
ncbi:MAG TPA: type II toxin-antitoxin system VapC family toxin [Spirochaetales bacterium]|nr:type II toxin-antitoxin system VapC family toxin [Spirochaetales bacterium]